MEILLSLSVFAMIVGLVVHFVVYGDGGWARLQQLGLPTYFAGLLVFLMQAGPQVVSLLD